MEHQPTRIVVNTISHREDHMTPAELIAANLHALPHPDGTPRQLAGFNTQLLPDAMQKQVQDTAKDIGAAIIHLLESSGYHITTETPTDPDDEPIQAANIHCTLCDAKLLTLNLVNPTHSLTNGPLFIEALTQLKPECPHQ